MPNIYAQLIQAQLENTASDFTPGIKGLVFFNTTGGEAKVDDGSAIRTLVTTDNTQTLTNKKLSDSTTSIVDNADNTKVAKLECSGITTATTRTITVPDRSGTLSLSGTPPTTKGDILAFTGTDLVRVAAGSNTHVLTADSGEAAGVKWAAQNASPDQSYELRNLGLATSVAASALTVALKQKDGSTDPTGGSPVYIGFRSSTITSGLYVQRSVTAALSVVIPSGTSIGMTSNYREPIFVYVIDNAGTVELALSLSPNFDEGVLYDTSAISGGSSRVTLYSTTARTGVAVRLIGRIDIEEATAGTWASNASALSLTPMGSLQRQVVNGATQTADSTLASASYANFTNAITVGFTASTTGLYKIYGTISGYNNPEFFLQIVATTGTPEEQIIQATRASTGANDTIPCTPFTLARLVAGTAYVFQLQGKASAGTITLQGSLLPNGHFLVAEQMY